MSAKQILNRQGPDWGRVIVNAIASEIKKEIDTLCHEKPIDFAELKRSHDRDKGMQHLIYRLTREVLFEHGNRIMNDFLSKRNEDVVAMMNFREAAASASHSVINRWMQIKNPLLQGSTSHGRNKHRSEQKEQSELPAEKRKVDYVKELQEMAIERFPSDTRDIYDRVRNAEFTPISPADAGDIVKSYNDALLDNETLETLSDPEGKLDTKTVISRIESFRARMMEKGGFIHPMDEEELREELDEGSERTYGMPLRGWKLKAADGKKELLGWFTFRHAPKKSSSLQRKSVRHYLRHGVTGGGVTFLKESNRQTLLEDCDKIELFQDIRCHVPYASTRLFAHGFNLIAKDNPAIEHLLAYHLFDLDVEPALDLDHKQGSVFRDENRKSSGLFYGHGFFDLAKEPKKRRPESAATRMVDGVERKLYPTWQIIGGNMKDIAARTRANWRKIMIAHGDLSQDKIPETMWGL